MFVRSILAISLSCIFATSTFAASTAEQSLIPKKIEDVAVEDPIDPLAVGSTTSQIASEAIISSEEQQDLNLASQTLDNLQKSEDNTAAIGTEPAVQTKAPTTITAPTSAND